MSEVARVIVPCSGESESRYLAKRIFTAIHRYHKENGIYIENGITMYSVDKGNTEVNNIKIYCLY